jgi:hypothetical protein
MLTRFQVHERSVEGDFLLLELREILSRHENLKVVLMSATINHETFVKYFNNAPMLTIPGFAYPVTDKLVFLKFPLSMRQILPVTDTSRTSFIYYPMCLRALGAARKNTKTKKTRIGLNPKV